MRRWLIGAGAAAVLAAAGAGGLLALDRLYPPKLPGPEDVSTVVLDQNGALLRAFALGDGRWRLPVEVADVDPKFVKMLVTYEDRRFYEHHGVDVRALFRAGWQLVTHGHIVSGGSTLTMQVVRLIDERKGRSFLGKAQQIFRALQLEERLTKDQILALYLTLAPYGSNLEGVRAASLSYFGKEPKTLTTAEAALLVALPQSPEARRPDRSPDRARAARGRVLDRAATFGAIEPAEAARAASERVPSARVDLPALAAHLAQDAVARDPGNRAITLTLERPLQEALEAVARDHARELQRGQSVALLLADSLTGRILAQVGSPGLFDKEHAGDIDMANAERSPGSALKPLIYGIAFEEGLVLPETTIEDRPASFRGYRPTNFDLTYQGDVTVRQALQMSLNVPAVRLLDAVGPQRFASRLTVAGVAFKLPDGEAPGLPMALGGLGITLRDIVQLYTVFPNGGRVAQLGDGRAGTPKPFGPMREVLSHPAAWYVTDILAGVAPPEGALRNGIAYKTGTSFGYRDSWAIGFDGRYVLGVWTGRPDGAPSPGFTGRLAAAPVLFDAFSKLSLKREPLPRSPSGTVRLSGADLPAGLKRFTSPNAMVSVRAAREDAPVIVYPPDGARVDLGLAQGPASDLVLKLEGGRAPFRWLANGRPMDEKSFVRQTHWKADSAGYSTLTVIDAAGRSASVRVFVD
ncbi:MAG: penicillin-binding protein 1C [Hyphomicrobiales bacterium]